MRRNNILTEEGQTRFRNTLRRVKWYLLIMACVALGSAYAIHRFWLKPNFTPLQRVYLRQYVWSTAKSNLHNSRSTYKFLTATRTDRNTGRDVLFGLTDKEVEPVLDYEGNIERFNGNPAFVLKAGVSVIDPAWTQEKVLDTAACDWFRRVIYEDKSLLALWRPAWLGASGIFLLGLAVLIGLDQLAQYRYVKGDLLRGTRKLSPRKYQKEHYYDYGYGLTVYAAEQEHKKVGLLEKLLGVNDPPYWLTIPRKEENEGLLLHGDPGTGKSQVIHQLLTVINSRISLEAFVCYDPAGEFTERHFNPGCDLILNPLDERCPYWSPAGEIEGEGDLNGPQRQFIAESFFPRSSSCLAE